MAISTRRSRRTEFGTADSGTRHRASAARRPRCHRSSGRRGEECSLSAHCSSSNLAASFSLSEQRLPLTHHDVLLKLSEAPGGQQRMSELADRVLLTKGGLTRVVDVLEKDGFVERVRSQDDGRGRYARLTPAGRARFQAAHPVHVRGVRALFLDKLSDDQLHCLAETWHTVLSEGWSRQLALC